MEVEHTATAYPYKGRPEKVRGSGKEEESAVAEGDILQEIDVTVSCTLLKLFDERAVYSC